MYLTIHKKVVRQTSAFSDWGYRLICWDSSKTITIPNACNP